MTTNPDLRTRLSSLRANAPTGVKGAGRAAARVVGRGSAGARLLPDVLLVGAQRAGTTSLHRALSAHPQVTPPLFHKGVHYFDVAYQRGLPWYRGHFPVASVARLRTRRAGPPLTLESSGYYMHHPLAPGRIARDLPGVRLLVMLRDPVERAYSAHRHEVARGFDDVPFEEALDLEPQRLAGEVERMRADPSYISHAHRHHSYVDRGLYVAQLVQLFDLFGRESVHVIFSEDFYQRPEQEYARLLSFLELSAWSPPTFERWNARPRAPMSEVVRRRLETHFEPYDDAMAELLGEQPSWRR